MSDLPKMYEMEAELQAPSANEGDCIKIRRMPLLPDDPPSARRFLVVTYKFKSDGTFDGSHQCMRVESATTAFPVSVDAAPLQTMLGNWVEANT